MGGLFGCVSKNDCLSDLFYGTDYHSHLGTKRGGLAVKNGNDFSRSIHNIENDYFSANPRMISNLFGGALGDIKSGIV